MYVDWGPDLAKEGDFTVAVNYRLATAAFQAYPGALDDLDNLNKALNGLVLHANKRKLDLERVGLIGDFAGGYLATAFALRTF